MDYFPPFPLIMVAFFKVVASITVPLVTPVFVGITITGPFSPSFAGTTITFSSVTLPGLTSVPTKSSDFFNDFSAERFARLSIGFS